jgi:hypothetical protein
MSQQDDYLGRVQAIVWWAADYLSPSGIAQAQELVSHGEPAEGLCYLAWGIVNEDVRVPRKLVDDIREHVRGIVDDQHMPASLDKHAE